MFQGVKGRVGLANQKGRLEGDDLIAPHHWDQTKKRLNGFSRNIFGKPFRGVV